MWVEEFAFCLNMFVVMILTLLHKTCQTSIYCHWTQDMIHGTSTHGILDLHFVQDLFATLEFYYSMDGPG